MNLIRTTIGKFLLSGNYNKGGIYVIACYPSLGCIYVGRSVHVKTRLNQHLRRDNSRIGKFLRNNMADSIKFRLDIIQGEDAEWLYEKEKSLIEYFRPIFNEHLLGERSYCNLAYFENHDKSYHQ